MKVFVTGGSGFVGREILRQLHAAGHSIRLLARHPNSKHVQQDAARFNAQIHPGNVLDPASLTPGLANIDAIIHLVGIISELGSNTYENVHTRGTQNMVTAAQQAGVKRFLQMSALGTRPKAIARYHQSKWAAEEIVRRSGLDWTIFRPSIIYGPDDQFINLFARISKFSPVLPVIGGGQSKLQPVPVADVASSFVRALMEPQSIGQTYDLAGRDILSFVEVLDAILAVTNRKRLKLPIPMGLARFQAAALEFIFPKLLGKAPPLNRDQLIMLGEDNSGNPERANALFHLRPIPFREGIASYLKP
jgi:NADH dehydrogenase